jgi:uncharacterized membrane protein YhaH (DUF805 family)
MTFFEAIAKCYRRYFVFKGRAPKSEFWWFYLLAFLFAWPLVIAPWASIYSFIYFILTLSVLFPFAAVWTRRMHDIGKAGWNIFFIFLPVIGWMMILRWTMKAGDEESNKYGAPDNHPFVVPKKSMESK